MKNINYKEVPQAALLLQIFALMLLLAACDSPNTVSAEIGSVSSALSADADTGTIIPIPEEKFEFGDESSDKTVSINWMNDDVNAIKKKVDVLSLKLINYLDKDLTAHVTVRFSGLLMEVATLDLGEMRLGAKSEIPLTISTGDLPMQTTTGVCQAVATLEVTGDGGYSTAEASEALYYRHLPNYKGAQIFGENVFFKEDKGKFFDIGKSVRAKGIKVASTEILGRIKKEKGVFEDVTASTKGAMYAVEGGDPVIVIGASFGGAPMDPLEELREMNNEDK